MTGMRWQHLAIALLALAAVSRADAQSAKATAPVDAAKIVAALAPAPAPKPAPKATPAPLKPDAGVLPLDEGWIMGRGTPFGKPNVGYARSGATELAQHCLIASSSFHIRACEQVGASGPVACCAEARARSAIRSACQHFCTQRALQPLSALSRASCSVETTDAPHAGILAAASSFCSCHLTVSRLLLSCQMTLVPRPQA